MLFIALFVFTLKKKGNDISPQKRKDRKSRSKASENNNPEKLSEIDKSFKGERSKHKEKYPYTETLTTLLDCEEAGSTEDFTTSLLSDREQGNQGTYSEIDFKTGSFASSGETIDDNELTDDIDSLEERTQLLENLTIENREEEPGTSLLFEEEENATRTLDLEIEASCEQDETIEQEPAVEEKVKDDTVDEYTSDAETDDEGIFEIENERALSKKAKRKKRKEQHRTEPEKEPEKELEESPEAEAYFKYEEEPLNNTADGVEPSEPSLSFHEEDETDSRHLIFQNRIFAGKEFDNLADAVFINCKIFNCKFTEKNLKNARFIFTDIEECSFLGSDMQHALFDNTTVKKSTFRFADIKKAKMINSVFEACSFEKTMSDECLIDQSLFPKCKFDDDFEEKLIILR